mmetsp:Transcript_80105/g.214502  ORF Transcript_80105/g.214502 Transcript_80105/m.214502 type:complete len:253 (+) Transcript_80105:207-965(+)
MRRVPVASAVRLPRRAHGPLLLAQEVLLRADDAPRTNQPQPRDGLARREGVVLHEVHADERASPPQPSVAVHRNGARRRLHQREKAVDDSGRRRGAVGEEKVVQGDPHGREGCGVVARGGEPHHPRRTEAPQNARVVLGAEVAAQEVAVVVVNVGVHLPRGEVLGPPHRNEFVRHDAMEIGVEGVVIVLVFAQVEAVVGEIYPFQGLGLPQSVPAVAHVKAESLMSGRNIPKGYRQRKEPAELSFNISRFHI